MTEDQTNNYISYIPNLKYHPVDEIIWDMILEEGLDEEFEKYDKSNWYFAKLNLSDKDKIGLQSLDPDTIEKFNEFDIRLKDIFELTFIDLIDYDKGEVIIVSPFLSG